MTNKRMAVLAGMMACVTLLAPLAGCRRAVEVSSGYDEMESFIYIDGENSTVSDEGTSGDTSKTPGKKTTTATPPAAAAKRRSPTPAIWRKRKYPGCPRA